jgi:hypothetical protein
MGEHDAPLQKHFGQISQAQCIPKSPQDDQQNHISGIFQEVEGCSCTLVEEALASGATTTVALLCEDGGLSQSRKLKQAGDYAR